MGHYRTFSISIISRSARTFSASTGGSLVRTVAAVSIETGLFLFVILQIRLP